MRRNDFLIASALCMALPACSQSDNGTARPAAVETRPAPPTVAPAAAASSPAHQVDDALSRHAARQVVVDYYAAINARDYRKAYSSWSEDGAASGQSFDLFSGGYAGTESVEAIVGEAAEVEGAAGSRYTTVAVELHARQKDGGERDYRGRFTLRQLVADGASETQRQWHLYSAEMQRIGGP